MCLILISPFCFCKFVHKEAAVCRFSTERMLLKIYQNSQARTCAQVSLLITLQPACNFIETEIPAPVLSCEFCKIFKRTVPDDCFYLWQSLGEVARRCFVKKVFLKISQNSQENIFVAASFLIKFQASRLQLY